MRFQNLVPREVGHEEQLPRPPTQHLRVKRVACTLLGKRTAISQLCDQPSLRRPPNTSCVFEANGVRVNAHETALFSVGETAQEDCVSMSVTVPLQASDVFRGPDGRGSERDVTRRKKGERRKKKEERRKKKEERRKKKEERRKKKEERKRRRKKKNKIKQKNEKMKRTEK